QPNTPENVTAVVVNDDQGPNPEPQTLAQGGSRYFTSYELNKKKIKNGWWV
ncbi:hypothetical protein M9458_042541, partial [Cirrhinus mrigala]